MTTHLDTNPSIFSLPTLRTGVTETRSALHQLPAGRGRVPAFLGVLVGNIVLWSTLFIGVGIVLAVQVGLVALLAAAMMR